MMEAMDGIHDMGGMHGFGPVEMEPDEPVFHHPWEGRAFGLAMTSSPGNTDQFRHAMERMGTRQYLGASYYERWLGGLERLLLEKGVITEEELQASLKRVTAGEEVADEKDPDRAAALARVFRTPPPAPPPVSSPPAGRFAVGQAVAVRNAHPDGHTRCPGYLRRARGVVERVHGSSPLPDVGAVGGPAQVEPVYGVGFALTELWGDGADPRGRVTVDLWESYLEAV